MTSSSLARDTRLWSSPVLNYLRTQHCLGFTLLVVLTLTALGGVCDNKLIDLDDTGYVSENIEVMNGLNGNSIVWAFTTFTLANWHPLTWMSLQLDTTLFGTDDWVFHRTSLLLHLANVLLLFEALRQMMGAPWRSFLVAALFAVHPLHVESVAWVSERKDVLSTCFGLLALLAYLHYARKPALARMLPVTLLLAASLLSKPMLVTFPCLLLLLDYWPLRRLSRGSPSAPENTFAPESPFWLVAEKAPLFFLSVASSLVTMLSQAHLGAVATLADIPLGLRLTNASHAIICYLEQLFYPCRLAVFYPYPQQALPWQLVLRDTLLLAAITGAVCWQVRARPYLFVGWFWFLGTLVPVIGLVHVGGQGRADHYTYVPLTGLFLLLVWGIWDVFGQRHRGVLAVLAAAILLGCVFQTRAQVRFWTDSTQLWKHAVEVTSNNPRAHAHYSMALFKNGEPLGALHHIDQALELYPRMANAHFIRGKILQHLGDSVAAEACYRRAIDIRPQEQLFQQALQDLLSTRQ